MKRTINCFNGRTLTLIILLVLLSLKFETTLSKTHKKAKFRLKKHKSMLKMHKAKLKKHKHKQPAVDSPQDPSKEVNLSDGSIELVKNGQRHQVRRIVAITENQNGGDNSQMIGQDGPDGANGMTANQQEAANKMKTKYEIIDRNENVLMKTKKYFTCNQNQHINCVNHCMDRLGVFNCLKNAKMRYTVENTETVIYKAVLCICNESKYRYNIKSVMQTKMN